MEDTGLTPKQVEVVIKEALSAFLDALDDLQRPTVPRTSMPRPRRFRFGPYAWPDVRGPASTTTSAACGS